MKETHHFHYIIYDSDTITNSQSLMYDARSNLLANKNKKVQTIEMKKKRWEVDGLKEY